MEGALCSSLSSALASPSLKRQFALASLVKTETEGVFSLDVFSSAWTAAIIPEVDQLATFGSRVARRKLVPGAVRFYGVSPEQRREAKPGIEGVILNNFPQARAFTRRLVKEVIEPVSVAYLRCASKKPADKRRHRWLEPLRAHIVSYSASRGPRGHFPHVDDSGLTINVCLGPTFTGGELVIDNKATIPQVPGRAIVHEGRLPHHSNDIASGERYNLVVWCSLHESFLETFAEFGELPVELQQTVVDWLPLSDLCALRLVSRSAHQLVENARQWRVEAREAGLHRQADRGAEGDHETWRQAYMRAAGEHRFQRLQSQSPMTPLLATRFHNIIPELSAEIDLLLDDMLELRERTCAIDDEHIFGARPYTPPRKGCHLQ